MVVKNYFASGNTAQGFINYLTSNLQNIEKIYILKGDSATAKSSVFESVCSMCEYKSVYLEVLHCPSNPNLFDGIIFPDSKIAIVDSNVFEPAGLNKNLEYIDLDIAIDSNILNEEIVKIINLKNLLDECKKNAYISFAEGLLIHDEWEKFYIENMDFESANKLTLQTIELILKDSKFEKKSLAKHRFFGASTPSGSMDYIDNITTGIAKRYLIKGRPGTGKSTLLKKLVAKAAECGLVTDVYHCGFDSNSLDMVILPEINTCIFDSTAPHLYEKSRPNDEIIDMYAKCVKPDTDEKYQNEIKEIGARYKIAVQNGIRYLSDAKKISDEIESYYLGALDFSRINKIKDKILKDLNELI